MKISTRGVYGIEAMIDLGYHSKDKVESIKNIAKRRNLSEKYLEQIVGKLRKAGLIISTRGAGGGYQLVKAPKDILVKDILMAVEGDLAPVECLTQESDCGMNCAACAARTMWSGMWNAITQVVDNVTLEQLITEMENNCQEPEFYI